MTSTPRRIQRRRLKGWRAEDHSTSEYGARYVGRGTPFGNPWAIVRTDTRTGWAVQWAGHANQHKPLGLNDLVPADNQRDAHALAVELYGTWVHAHPALLARIRCELAGRDLVCWCADSLPCHADVLLELANQPQPAARPRHHSQQGDAA